MEYVLNYNVVTLCNTLSKIIQTFPPYFINGCMVVVFVVVVVVAGVVIVVVLVEAVVVVVVVDVDGC